jgi:hypothetical protein
MPNDQIPFSGGPFTSAITPPTFEEPQQQFSGFSGTGGNLAGLASHFLAGVSQGRQAAFQRSEAQKSKSEQALIGAMEAVGKSNLPDAVKQQQTADLQKMLGHTVLGTISEGEKQAKQASGGQPDPNAQPHPGQHFLGAIKGFLKQALGPGAEKQAYSPEEISSATDKTFALIADHGNSVQAQMAKVDDSLQQAHAKLTQKLGHPPSREEAMADADFQHARGQAVALGGNSTFLQQFDESQKERDKYDNPLAQSNIKRNNALSSWRDVQAKMGTPAGRQELLDSGDVDESIKNLSPQQRAAWVLGGGKVSTATPGAEKDPAALRVFEDATRNLTSPDPAKRQGAQLFMAEKGASYASKELSNKTKSQAYSQKAQESGGLATGGTGMPPNPFTSRSAATPAPPGSETAAQALRRTATPPPGKPQTKAQQVNADKPRASGEAPPKPFMEATHNERDQDMINQYLSSVLGTLPGSTRSGAARLPLIRGQKLLMQSTGMSEEQLSAALSDRKGVAKALQVNTQKIGAFSSLQNRVDQMGKLLIQARDKVSDTGGPFVNKLSQHIAQNFTGDPETARLVIAANGMAREYAQVMSNGFSSNAQIPVSSAEDAQKAIAGYFTKGTISGIVDQLKMETVANKRGMYSASAQLFKQLSKPIEGKNPYTKPSTGTPPATQQANGKTGAPPAAAAAPKTADDFVKLIKQKYGAK